MSSLTLRPTAPCRRQHDLLLDPSSGNGAPSRWQKTGDKSAHLNQASPLKSANLLHKHVAASPALSVTHAPSTGCYLQTRSCPVPRNGPKKGWKTCIIVRVRCPSTTKHPSFVVLCGFFRDAHSTTESATASLPSGYLHYAALRSPAGVAKRRGCVSVLGLHVSWQ